MIDDSNFIRFIGQLVFAPEQCAWHEFSAEKQAQYCRLAQQNNLGIFLLCVLKKDLPEQFVQIFKDIYLKELLKRLWEEKKLKDFYRFLESEKIKFLPIKGADLAFRIYPDGVLRAHHDWDILFHEENCLKVYRLLQENGWKNSTGYAPKEENHHHYEPLFKESQLLEIHRTLPHFGDALSREIWAETQSVNDYHKVLTPEMNLLLLAAHASHSDYTHVSPWKILLDAGFILKHDHVDWHKVHALADRWGILRPDILLGAWCEFFPEGTLPAASVVPEQQKLIREIFAGRSGVLHQTQYEKAINRAEQRDFSWIRHKIRCCFNAQAICQKYNLNAGCRCKIFLYSCHDVFHKALYFLFHRHDNNPVLQRHNRNVKKLEALIRHER